MYRTVFLAGAAAFLGLLTLTNADAGDRYAVRPPVVVSPDLSAPWVMQLGQKPGQVLVQPQRRVLARPERRVIRRAEVEPQRRVLVQPQQDVVRTSAVRAKPRYSQEEMRKPLEPKFLPHEVSYDGPGKAGEIVIDSANKFLYLIETGGKARRYGVGVGKEGFGWTGVNPISRKAEWPDWIPPVEMIARERAKGRALPARMDGGLANPLGARALYLGSTLYRIHGTNAPWTIGQNVSSGCIRMRNEDVIDLYERVNVGTIVRVI